MGFRFLNLDGLYLMAYRISRTASGRSCLNRHLLLASSAEHQNHSRITRRWHLGHSHHHEVGGKGADGVFKLGLAADIALAAGKSVTGYLTGSTAITADAVHSISDVVLSGIALWSFRAAKVPKDKEHPYGLS